MRCYVAIFNAWGFARVEKFHSYASAQGYVEGYRDAVSTYSNTGASAYLLGDAYDDALMHKTEYAYGIPQAIAAAEDAERRHLAESVE